MTDHDAHGPAIALITRDLARARDDGADDDWTARSILTDLMGAGWRRVIEPPPGPGGPATPPTAEFLAARAAIEAPGAVAEVGEPDCIDGCDTDCEVGPRHCVWIHLPNHKPGWHSQDDCPAAP